MFSDKVIINNNLCNHWFAACCRVFLSWQVVMNLFFFTTEMFLSSCTSFLAFLAFCCCQAEQYIKSFLSHSFSFPLWWFFSLMIAPSLAPTSLWASYFQIVLKLQWKVIKYKFNTLNVLICHEIPVKGTRPHLAMKLLVRQ